MSTRAEIWCLAAVFFVTGILNTQSAPMSALLRLSELNPPQAFGYHLAFYDDFDSLDLSPNSLGDHVWYNPGMWWQKPAPYANISAANSILHLRWTRGQSPNNTSIATAAKDGSHHRAWRYGYFETRLRWEPVVGAWPAFWMIPVQNITGKDKNASGARYSGEIDIMEAQGASPHVVTVHLHDWRGGVDAGPPGFDFRTPADLRKFHTYGILWVPGRVTWYFDDQPFFSVATPSVMDEQDYYLIVGSQAGVNWSQDLAGVTADQIAVDVDWIRVWQP